MQKLLFSKKVFILVFAFSFLFFLVHTYFTKTAVFADGRFYYAITRSLVKDRDIKFGNEYVPLGVSSDNKTGYVWNMYPPGSSFAWTPLFFIADGFSYILKNIGISTDTAGYGIAYQSSVALSSIFLGTLGLVLINRLLSDNFSEKVAMLTSLVMFLTTNLLFYIAVEPINSHSVSFFVSTLFVFYFLRHKTDKNYYLILGMIGGIAGLTRTQDLLILILPAINNFIQNKNGVKKLTTNYFLLSAGAVLGFAPQIYFWKKIFGTFWHSPYINVGFELSLEKFLYTLFNDLNGLFYITPVIAISLIGLLVIWRSKKISNLNKQLMPKRHEFTRILNIISSYALTYFATQLFLVMLWKSSIGGSYSNRMMITTYALLSFGLAEIIKIVKEKYNLRIVLFLTFIFGLNNSVQIIRYLLLY